MFPKGINGNVRAQTNVVQMIPYTLSKFIIYFSVIINPPHIFPARFFINTPSLCFKLFIVLKKLSQNKRYFKVSRKKLLTLIFFNFLLVEI